MMLTYSAINHLRSLTKTLKLECGLRWSSSGAALKTIPAKSLIKVAIVGAPNSGKSTLINQIVKRKVFPISSKVHTTRWKARAVLNEGNTQLIFVDTPGLVTASETKKYKLSSEFVCDGEDAISDADVIGVVHDLSNEHTNKRLDPKVLRLLHIYRQKESFLILNKTDTLKSKRTLLDLSKKLTGDKLNVNQKHDDRPLSETAIAELIKEKPIWENFSDVFMISALLGQGVDDLKKYLLNSAHPGEWIFPEESFTDQNHVQIIEETVRSKLLDALPQEVPYNLKVELEFLDIEASGRIVAVVLVHCKTARLVGLVKGQRGKRIREISEETKQSLADAFFSDIDLTIIVDQLKKTQGTLSDE